MVIQTRTYTLEKFLEFASQPENEDRLFELIDGEIIEKLPGRTYYSLVRDVISHAVWSFCEANELPCYTSGEAGSYTIGGHVVAPDFAYKNTPMSQDYPDPNPPLWVVEVISPTEKAIDIRSKRQIYLDAGILYWEVYAVAQSVDVYAPGQPMKTVGIDGALDGGAVLPGFALPVERLFKQ